MTEAEVQELVNNATSVDTFEHGSPDSDDYFTATLYQTTDDRHFRHIDSAGMDSGKNANTGEWLTEAEVKQWTAF